MITMFFKTYGCQANVADSQGLIKYLESIGCCSVESEELADIIMVNTCAIRDKAEQKMFAYLGRLARYKKQKPYLKIGVIGCVASYKKDEIYRRFDHVNVVFGAREELGAFQHYLFDMVTKLETTKQLYEKNPEATLDFGRQDRVIGQRQRTTEPIIIKPAFRASKERIALSAATLGGLKKTSGTMKQSFINITSGCNNYCTYCIVPFTRGREKSYPLAVLLERVIKDVAEGAQEINLVGQNVNSYQCPETGMRFAQLLEKIAQVEGEFWVRYISPHPKDMTLDVLHTMGQYKDKLCGWVHFPLQSGSDSVLQAMNRTYTSAEYLAQIDSIRQILPHATISTDIIVGFPGETEQDYEDTRRIMEIVKYDFMFSFVYSRRQYTKAYRMGDTCSEEEKLRRLELLQKRQKEICEERNNLHVGTIQKVLVEKRFTHDKLLARTQGNIRALLEGPDVLIGTFPYVRIESAGVVNLQGVLVSHPDEEQLNTKFSPMAA